MFPGSRPQKALEAFKRPKSMDAGQTGGCICPPPVHGAPQTAGITPLSDFPTQQTKVRVDEL